jgi:hypothetical protein
VGRLEHVGDFYRSCNYDIEMNSKKRMITQRPHPTDVCDEEWSFVVPYLTLMDSNAPQRKYELREMFNALRWLVRAGAGHRTAAVTNARAIFNPPCPYLTGPEPVRFTTFNPV